MKKSISLSLIIMMLAITSVVRAQYVAIPDSNFGHWLSADGYATCVIGNGTVGYQLDTTCPVVINTTSLDLQYSYLIRDLTGVTFFRNLTYLNITQFAPPPFYTGLAILPDLPASLLVLKCDRSTLTSLPALPPALDTLMWYNSTHLSSLPALPSTLRYLDCSWDSLPALPALPASLLYLSCGGNRRIISLPTLPAGLQYLSCSSLPLSPLPTLPTSITTLDLSASANMVLPTILPPGLQSLSCTSDSISSLPALPSTLQYLYCGFNPLTTLPALPSGLKALDISNSLVGTLAPLPPSLNFLYCDNTPITVLPAFPDTFEVLHCSHTGVSSIPRIPHYFGGLDCSYCPNVYCLPQLPRQLFELKIAGTHITCLPGAIDMNYPVMFDIWPPSLPLCSPSSGCAFYDNISGQLHYDSSATCTADSLHHGYAIPYTKVLLKQAGQVIQQAYSSDLGEYSFRTDSMTGYTVEVDTAYLPFTVHCPVSAVRSVVLSATDTVEIAQDFGMSCTSRDTFPVDFGVNGFYRSRTFRPGTQNEISVELGDLAFHGRSSYCAHELPNTDTSGTLTVTYSGPVQYLGNGPWSITPSSVSGQTLTYRIPNMNTIYSPFFWRNIGLQFATDSTATLGTSVCLTAILTPDVADVNPLNDTFTQCYQVTNSYDPNLKEVSPETLTPDGGWLTYTVHFQNTGNDTAYTVVVRDTLSSYVQAESFQYLESSHHVITQVVGNAVTFTFPKTNLVDSATNPPLSEGWLRYKVLAKANLPLRTQVKNTAYIYFDLNAAVVTNTTVNKVDTVAAPLGIAPIAATATMRLYPNPNTGSFTLITSNAQRSDYTITDMLGNLTKQDTIASDRQYIDMSSAASGVYTLSLKGARAVRFVVVK